MCNFSLTFELQGNPGSVECVIDELLSLVGFMDLDSCSIKINKLECIGHD